MFLEDFMKNFISEFKKFITKGNVVDMAVGIIIGSSFTAIVNSLVNDIIMPFVSLLIGGINFTDLKLVIRAATETTAETAINFGVFLQNIVNFLIVAFVLFTVVKTMNKLRAKKEEPKPAAPAPTPEDILLLREIRDSLKKD